MKIHYVQSLPLGFSDGVERAALGIAIEVGYDFGGWYNKEGGAAANGAEFSEEYFPFNADVVLYANWVAHVYTITLDCGEFGTVDGQRTLTAEVAYGSDFVLPVPDVNYEIKVFTYWCASADGYGVAYTDSEGRSRIKWSHTSEDIVLYAYYVDAIDYVRDGDGYAVKAGPRISQVTHLIIPATYTPVPTDENPNPETLKVVSIQDYAFLNCTKLVSVSIPNTVRTISLTAFDGCRYIERYEVREIEGEIDPVYFAQEGTLLYRNIVMQGEVEIALVPATFTGSYRIPDAVTKITQNAFAKTKLEEIIVPASVKTVARANRLKHAVQPRLLLSVRERLQPEASAARFDHRRRFHPRRLHRLRQRKRQHRRRRADDIAAVPRTTRVAAHRQRRPVQPSLDHPGCAASPARFRACCTLAGSASCFFAVRTVPGASGEGCPASRSYSSGSYRPASVSAIRCHAAASAPERSFCKICCLPSKSIMSRHASACCSISGRTKPSWKNCSASSFCASFVYAVCFCAVTVTSNTGVRMSASGPMLCAFSRALQ